MTVSADRTMSATIFMTAWSIMETPRHSRALTLSEIMPRMANHPDVERLLTNELPLHPLTNLLALMRLGQTEGVVGADLHDTMIDAIVNEAQTVWHGTRETEDDSYGFEVAEFGGAFIVRATELDDVGYFVSRDDAIRYIIAEYRDVTEDE